MESSPIQGLAKNEEETNVGEDSSFIGSTIS
jgi:hypothetical protein